MNRLEFELFIKRNECSKRDISEYLGISEQALQNKLKQKSEFKSSEIYKFCRLFKLELRDPIVSDIFFNPEVN